ncbi:MAG TPA: acetyl-CoA hydrolase/transferase C-terminal domain-containing protein [Terriglobales bacterium]|nr:acetyl-CoA hydrolase/transferase C-terminal domain-containing protein [Terriglobales bacterium]
MRIVSADEAVSEIKSGQQVFMHGAAATPTVLLEALVRRAPELRDVKIVHMHAEGPHPHLEPNMQGHFLHKALFIGPNARKAINEGRAEFIPVFLSDIPRLIDQKYLPLDAVLCNVSPPDEHGFCSLGTSVDAMLSAVRMATSVIVQFNKSMPRTLGDSFIHISKIDCAVEVDQPPYDHSAGAAGEIEQKIGGFVADLIQDEATLQMGIGDIPSAVGQQLYHKKNLGVHTEMFTDILVDLVERGVVTCDAKEVNCGKIVTSFMMGTQRLYKFVDNNPMVEMRPVDYTNDTALIRRFKRMTAINSAIEVDITGQVCADSIGSRMYSGVGGQMDFMRGAALAEEGQAIIALPSTAAGGKFSRIAMSLKEGAGVTTTRSHVQTIVTEYGVAQLFGQSLRERAKRLIAIAHPDFRDELTAYAKKHHDL